MVGAAVSSSRSSFPDVQLHIVDAPLASPVKEKYSPAAVKAHDTISMALSSCTPLSPMICTSEITESTRAAASAQRGQFLSRLAASQTK